MSGTNLYPVTIVTDKFEGEYSGARYLAFALEPQHIPKHINGSPQEAAQFWQQLEMRRHLHIGKGLMPDLALQDLAGILLDDIRKFEAWSAKTEEPA